MHLLLVILKDQCSRWRDKRISVENDNPSLFLILFPLSSRLKSRLQTVQTLGTSNSIKRYFPIKGEPLSGQGPTIRSYFFFPLTFKFNGLVVGCLRQTRHPHINFKRNLQPLNTGILFHSYVLYLSG